ncbi:Galactofuranosyl transferase GlfT2 [Microbacterium laevaniformans]|uniref:Galactofuranosyl transferase GlfT2 n=2 Tax=Microbacterium laevaniformans TaxID=36807 RepID=A0A150HD39_9MICO|nr:Galactofuranosyl transferase GlfT2 [Microbacterium laevaniformans]
MANESDRWVSVNHTVFPVEGVAEVSALYVDTGHGNGSQPGQDYEILSRSAIRVFARSRVSTGTYFNAFPASYWQRYTAVRDVRLRVGLRGRGLLSVYKSSARGRSSAVASRSFEDESIEIDLPVRAFVDGGMYWFDVAAAEVDATVEDAEWLVPAAQDWTPGTVSIGITTFNRPSYCLNQIRTVGGYPDTVELIDRLNVVDQGTELVQDQPGFGDAAAALGEKLHLVRQPNLGGSGGFSRAMLETLRQGTSRYVLLLDDDAISEPEAIYRAVRFADFAVSPTIVGGGMLHLDDRAVLYTQGETWNYSKAWMAASAGTDYDHDFAEDTVRETPELHRRASADFNGWWMCLIPTAVIREIGLSLPVFLKFDDIEFSLRAGAHGYPTVCLPGVAVWHMAWHDKDPTRTWEEYFIHRNRWITAALHPGGKRAGILPVHSFLGDVKLLLMLQYSTVRLRHEALIDLLRGPEHLPGLLGTKQARLQKLRSEFSDARVVENIASLPPVRRTSRVWLGRITRPTNPLAALFLAARVGVRQLLVKESSGSRANPERIIAAPDNSWWRFADIDSALVTAPDGSGVAWYQRDRATMHRFLARSLRLHLLLAFTWPKLTKRYADALPHLVGEKAWGETFARIDDA